MRQKIVAGNWKMNCTIPDGIELIQDLIDTKQSTNNCQVVIAPPFMLLEKAGTLCKGKTMKIAAQNCAAWEKGAYTGEVSAAMIQSTGAEYVIIGHSERRSYFAESAEVLKSKVDITLNQSLLPIFCIGETLEEREEEEHFKVIKEQLEASLFHLSNKMIKKVVVAYEPVWAIGTGKTASTETAQEMHAYIRSLLTEKYNVETAESISILYGGSCKPGNAKELFSQKDIDGGLIGGASLTAQDFNAIINAI